MSGQAKLGQSDRLDSLPLSEQNGGNKYGNSSCHGIENASTDTAPGLVPSCNMLATGD